MFFPIIATLVSSLPLLARAQVTATGTNGPTNPAAPTFAASGSTVNQTSYSRLVSLNNVNDFCLFGPPVAGAGSEIGNLEAEVVAYCTQPRNGARLIPDGTITSAHFIKTPLYVQISGTWDGTKVDIVAGDYGGELDPHGATGEGNPVGGNVTSDVTGSDVFYQEWMMYVSSDAFFFRVCTAEDLPNGITAALQCEHELDTVGGNFVMAVPFNLPQSFDECSGDAAAPPGLYPQANGSTSTFRQRYTGQWTEGTTFTGTFTVGQTVTPEAPYTYPATSQCTTYSSISNGVNTANYAVQSVISTGVAIGTSAGNVTSSASTSAMTTSMSSMASSRATSMSSSSSGTGLVASASSAARSGVSAAASGVSSAAVGAAAGGNVFGLVDSGVATIAGLTFAGVVAAGALLL